MTKRDVIVLKDNTHAPAEAGDTIDHKLLPVSAEQGNILEAKDDGLFVASSSGGSRGEIIGLEPVADYQPFALRGHWYKLKYRTAGGEERSVDFAGGYPFKIVHEPRGSRTQNEGLENNFLQEQYRSEPNDYGVGLNVALATPVLNTPTVDGTTLKLSLEFHLGGSTGSKIPNSDQGVEVDLAELVGAKFTESQNVPNDTTGSDVPTTFIGAAREKLLAAPDKWLEVTINGERGVVPWFKLP